MNQSEPVLDVEGLYERLGDDADLIAELTVILGEDAPRLAAECTRAIAADDWTETYRLAHTLKGAAGNLCARRVQAVAADLERCARQGLLAEARAAGDELQREIQRLLPALRELHAACADRVPQDRRDG